MYLHDGAEHPPGKTPVSLAEAFTDPNGTLEPQQRQDLPCPGAQHTWQPGHAQTTPRDAPDSRSLGPVRIALLPNGLIAVLPAQIRFTSADDRRALHLESNQHHR